MRLNIDVGKDKVDAALQGEIDRLRKENAKLKRQLESSKAVGAKAEQQREEIAKLHAALSQVFKDHGWEFDVHECCS